MANVNGLVLLALLAILTVALRMPAALGVKVIASVVLPPGASEVAGAWVTLKSPAAAPLSTTEGLPVRVSAASPVLVMVKLRTSACPTLLLPKSVLLVSLGVLDAASIGWPLPRIVSVGASVAFHS